MSTYLHSHLSLHLHPVYTSICLLMYLCIYLSTWWYYWIGPVSVWPPGSPGPPPWSPRSCSLPGPAATAAAGRGRRSAGWDRGRRGRRLAGWDRGKIGRRSAGWGWISGCSWGQGTAGRTGCGRIQESEKKMNYRVFLYVLSLSDLN